MGDGEGGVEEDAAGESKGKKCEPHLVETTLGLLGFPRSRSDAGRQGEGGPARRPGGLTSYISSPPLPRRRDPGRFIMGFSYSPLIGPSPFLPIRLLNLDKTISSHSTNHTPFYSFLLL